MEQDNNNANKKKQNSSGYSRKDHLIGIVVSTSDCHPRGPGFGFLEVQGQERGPPSLVRTIGQLLDMRSSEIRLRKLKLRLMAKRFANHTVPCTAIWQQPLQSFLALRGCSAMDLIVESILTYGAEGWSLLEDQKSKIQGVEMDGIRRGARVSRLEKRRSEDPEHQQTTIPI